MCCVNFRGKFIGIEGAEMLDGKMIKYIKQRDGYKYFEILETDGVKHGEAKDEIRKDYIRCIRNILRSKLNRGNKIRAINTRAVSVIRYCLDKGRVRGVGKTGKLLTMY